MNLPCIKCGEEDCIRMNLDGASDPLFTCTQCDAEFEAADVEAILAAWTPVLKWAKACPLIEAEATVS